MKDMKTKIENSLSRSVCGGWDRTLLESILEQIGKGRNLSVKQKQTLGKVLARNNKEAQAIHDSWSEVYEKEYKSNARVLANYHMHQPYYKPMAKDILSGRIPERSKFLRMYDNKYSKKVITQHEATPKYDMGDYVHPRANCDTRHINLEHDALWSQQNKVVQSFRKRGGFVIEICAEIRSHAKGAKRYKLLPIGETTPIIV